MIICHLLVIVFHHCLINRTISDSWPQPLLCTSVHAFTSALHHTTTEPGLWLQENSGKVKDNTRVVHVMYLIKYNYYHCASDTLSLLFLPSSSRSSTGRERSEKPLISAPPSSRPGAFIRGGSSKELLETQTPDEPRRDREREGAEPRRPSVTEDKTEPERSRVREPGEEHCAGQHQTHRKTIL